MQDDEALRRQGHKTARPAAAAGAFWRWLACGGPLCYFDHGLSDPAALRVGLHHGDEVGQGHKAHLLARFHRLVGMGVQEQALAAGHFH